LAQELAPLDCAQNRTFSDICLNPNVTRRRSNTTKTALKRCLHYRTCTPYMYDSVNTALVLYITQAQKFFLEVLFN